MSGVFENTLCSTPYQGDYLATASATADSLDIAATAALIEREGLRFDGTAPVVIGNSGIAAVRTGDLTFSIGIKTPASFTDACLIGATAYQSGLAVSLSSAGNVVLSLSNIADFLVSSSTLSPNTVYIITYVRGTLYINGVVDSTISDTRDYAYPCVSLGATGESLNKFTGSIFAARFFNYNLTAAEIAALTRRGLVTLPEQRGGSMVALNTSAFVNGDTAIAGFTANATSWSGTVAGYSTVRFNSSAANFLLKNRKYRLSYNVVSAPASATVVIADGAGWQTNLIMTAGVQVVEFTYTGSGAGFVLFYPANVGAYNMTGVAIIPLGTLFEQDSGQRNAGYMVRDTSGNNADLILPASGVSIIDPAQRGTIRFTTNTNGNQQLGGSQVIVPTNARITSWVINCSAGTPNVTLGNVSGGAQYRASAAVATGDNDITLLTRFTATGNLWCASSSTATLKHTIQWEYIQ